LPIYKDKKRNTWYFRVYVVENGKHIQKIRSGFKTKSICRVEEQNFLKKYNYSISLDNNSINCYNNNFNNFVNFYLSLKKQDLKFQSYRSLKNRIEKHILPYFKDYDIDEITPIIYLNWKNYILEKNYKYSYISSLHRAMVNIFNCAIIYNFIEENIPSKVKNFKCNDYIENVDFWTYDEYNHFINIVDDIVYKTLFQTLFFTGLRIGECLALNWNDLKDNIIFVNKTLIRKTTNNYQFNSPKSKSSIRDIKIDNNLTNSLLSLKDYYKKFYGFNDNWFIFGGLKPLSTTTIERKKNLYCLKSNTKQIRIHDFRHSHATLLLSKGVPITVISKRLGHSKISITLDTYSHFINEDEDKAVLLLNNL